MNSPDLLHTASVFWFTGLSGAGKTTLAESLYRDLIACGKRVEFLDGDRIRSVVGNIGFTREERIHHLSMMAWAASLLENQGITVIASFITPYEAARDEIRRICKNPIIIYVSTSLEICESRDVKGLYRRARAGEIKNFTGIDDEFEAPKNADIVIDTAQNSIEKSYERLKSHLSQLSLF